MIFATQLNQKRGMPDPGNLHVVSRALQPVKVRLNRVSSRVIAEGAVNIASSGVCEQSIVIRFSFVGLEIINAVIGSLLTQAVFGWKQIFVTHPAAIPVIKSFVLDDASRCGAGNGGKRNC